MPCFHYRRLLFSTQPCRLDLLVPIRKTASKVPRQLTASRVSLITMEVHLILDTTHATHFERIPPRVKRCGFPLTMRMRPKQHPTTFWTVKIAKRLPTCYFIPRFPSRACVVSRGLERVTHLFSNGEKDYLKPEKEIDYVDITIKTM